MAKMRNDFVTNSSSTCYTIVGIPWSSKVNFDESDNPWDLVGKEVEKVKKNGVDLHLNVESTEGTVGLDLDKIQEDETIREFKTRIMGLLKKALPDRDLKYEKIKIVSEEFDQNF